MGDYTGEANSALEGGASRKPLAASYALDWPVRRLGTAIREWGRVVELSVK